MHQLPIESRFVANLVDNLNAEIALGTVANVEEAVRWLSYTYLHVRMVKNPLAYGIRPEAARDDYGLVAHRHKLIAHAAQTLDKERMVRYDARNGFLHITDLVRHSLVIAYIDVYL